MKNRYSSRRQPLDHSFLNQRLIGARSYDRIAGYFSSSILEVAGEALESISGSIRVVCNSDLDPKDVETARAANLAMRREWCASEPEKLIHENSPKRFRRLFDFLRSGKMQVKVLPSEKFGLVHGKAGVVTMADGTQTSFLGSTNETLAAWKLNYELVWEDDSPEALPGSKRSSTRSGPAQRRCLWPTSSSRTSGGWPSGPSFLVSTHGGKRLKPRRRHRIACLPA